MLKNPTATNFLEYLIWVVLIVSLIAFRRRFLRNKFPDSSLRYKSQKGIEIIGYLFIIIIT
ncbi:MAG: mechanosensitive ion channel family protein, partial [Saprospiraceae bacterium]|nr:mechanosensitive ion channel family protein [Saprospiraceae bacterium]